MQLEVRDLEGNVITTIEVFDDVFHQWEREAAKKGISVEAHILSLLRSQLKKLSEEVNNESHEA